MAIPGPNGIVWIRDGGVWKSRTAGDRIQSVPTGWVVPKVLYRATRTPTDIANGTTTWTSVASWITPTTSVPGCAIAKRPATQITYGARATWTTVTDVNADAYGFLVSVLFVNVTQSTSSNVTVDQSVGSADSPQWAQLDEVYAVIGYVNDNGSGPTTTTSHIFLGP